MFAHPEYQRILQRIYGCSHLGKPWHGTFYRSPRLRYTNRADILSGKGSLISGGRWNACGAFSAVYGALSSETALKESLEQAHYFGLEGHTVFPRGLVAMKADLTNVLDLTSGIMRKHLLISKKRIVETDWRKEQDKGREALTQAIGRAAHKTGFDGILAPSKADPAGIILVLFPENFHGKPPVLFINESEVPD
jgi:RES domain-containing protein